MRPIVNMLEEDRATDTGNKHKKLIKIARVVPEIYSRTDRQTCRQTYSSQYFTSAPGGEIIIEIFTSEICAVSLTYIQLYSV